MQQKLKYIKKVRHIFAVTAWTLIGVYALVTVLLHIPTVQRFIASETAHVLAQKLGTRVDIGSVNLGFLNRVIIDDVIIDDQNRHEMLNCHRISAKLDILPLLKGKISISSAQIFSMRAMLSKANAEAPLNCQFIIDSLASKDTTSHTPLDLHISSLVIRNTAVSYNRLDQPHKAGFDANHLAFDKISGHIILNTLTDDSLSLNMKKLSLEEQASGLAVNALTFVAHARKHTISLEDFNLQTDNSDISLDANALLNDSQQISDLKLQSHHSAIGTRDIALFVPALRDISKTLFVDADIKGTDKSLIVRDLSINSSERDLTLRMNARASSAEYIIDALQHPDRLLCHADIRSLHASGTLIKQVADMLNVKSPVIGRLGDIDYVAQIDGNHGDYQARGKLHTIYGDIQHDAHYDAPTTAAGAAKLTAAISTEALRLGALLDTDAVTDISADINASAKILSDNTLTDTRLSVVAPLLTLNGYPYRNTELTVTQEGDAATATIDIADVNANASIDLSAKNIRELLRGNADKLRDIQATMDVENVNPEMLGLTTMWPATTFSFKTTAHIDNLAAPIDGFSAEIRDFRMRGSSDSYACDALTLQSSIANGERTIDMQSDFGSIKAHGRFNPMTLHKSFTNFVAQKLPTLPGLMHYADAQNVIDFNVSLTDADILRKMLGVNLVTTRPVSINGYVNDIEHHADIDLDAPAVMLSGTTLDNTHLQLSCPSDTLFINAHSSRRDDNGQHLALSLTGQAFNNNLTTQLGWDNGHGNEFRGSINANSSFYEDSNGKAVAHVSILPSEIMMGDTLWNLHPSEISYSDSRLRVENFLVDHAQQHISINGTGSRLSSDSLVVNLKDVNVAYILNLVDFHSVEFSGYATGSAVAKSLFATPEAYASLAVSDFHFDNGRLGTLTVDANWDNDLGQINVDGHCLDRDVTPDADGTTDVAGYISIKRNYIDLDIKASNTRCEFMQTYCDSFLSDVNAWASGNVRIWGDLSHINLTGDAVASGQARVNALNTVYSLRNDSVHFVHNDILVPHCVIYDRNGNHGVLSGAIHHEYLSRVTFDLNVSAEHLLCFDFPTLNGEIFCGYVVGTGSCKMTGRPGDITFDIDAYPEETSQLTYNASSPDALQNQEFITWTTEDSAPQPPTAPQSATPEIDDDFRTNIHLNFLIHATPASTLRLIMDERTGDIITLNGSGTLRANYYNKGGMQIYGNYNVDHGEYKMTIQQVITKSFEFLPGGTLSFGGDPMEAAINLQAQYVVPSVPLSDLNIGNSFSNNTVRVNCLMNITGTAQQPRVEFDLNLPQASTDIQQMITSLMDSEQERNQQVLYLLSIGRFYAADNNASAQTGQSQASLAMQSFLSGTLSQQLNSIISDVVLKDRNWNFGANISPGDEGMMNAEYEGLISGRMLNNRLLINGQFGYRDNANATTSFIGDFDVRYLLFPNGNLQVRVYNQTSDRYFTKSSLNTQGLGIVWKHDFNSLIPNFLRKKE